jgi:hypothetical protein
MSRSLRRLLTGLLGAVCCVVLTPLHDAHAVSGVIGAKTFQSN